MKAIIYLTLFLLLLTSCSTEEVHSNLIFGFTSYSTYDQINKELAKRGAKWKVLEDSKSPPTNNKPRFDIKEIRVEGLVNTTSDGIFLSFFNDKLMRIWFSVKNMDDAKKVLNSYNTKNIKFHLGQEIIIDKNVKLTIEKDRDGNILITCENVILAEERWDWIMKYS